MCLLAVKKLKPKNTLSGKRFSANFHYDEQMLGSTRVSTSQAKRKLEIEQVIKALFSCKQ